ncbi:Hint domain-containing protein [Novipirellula maiorica]|uniref:Hint domain-containing protein n=1 Tax=Novipirellula maiorica TaxID=1265734 RepID=UPI00118185ED|nr:Hint domain-containing protein [Rhodopirellula maiorica]
MKWLPCAAILCRDAYNAEHGGCASDYPDDAEKREGCERAAWYIQQAFCTQSLTSPSPPSTDPPVFPKSHFPCFAPDTIVPTPIGPKKIAEVSVGDMVYGFNFNLSRFEATRVKQVLLHDDGEYWLNQLEVGTSEVVEVTDGHPLFTGREWILPHEFRAQEFVSRNQNEVFTRIVGQHTRKAPVVINLLTESGTYLVGEHGLIASGTVTEDE